MTAPRELLDHLDALHAAGTRTPWAQQNGAPNLVYGDPQVGIYVCDTGHAYESARDADLIVAAVNALPQLTAALRELANLADSYPLGSNVPVYRLHRILDALSPADPMGSTPAMGQP